MTLWTKIVARNRRSIARLRIETLEGRELPSTNVGDGVMGPFATKADPNRPALVQAPKMPGLADLDPAIAGAEVVHDIACFDLRHFEHGRNDIGRGRNIDDVGGTSRNLSRLPRS